LNPGVWWGPILKNLRKKRKRDEGGRERKEGRKEASLGARQHYMGKKWN
jgi:hypothetical protein